MVDQANTMKSEAEKYLRLVIGIALRRWRWVVLGVLLATISGVYRYVKAPRIYQAASQVVLNTSTPSILGRRVESVSDPQAGRWRDQKYMKTQHKLMCPIFFQYCARL